MRTRLSTAICFVLFSTTSVSQNRAVVSGTLTTRDGSPAIGVRVAAVAVPEAGTPDGEALALVSLAQTDARGRYQLDNLPPGRYYIAAGLLTSLTYFPGVATTAGATVLTIREGSSYSVIDFVAVPSSLLGGGVRGQVDRASLPNAIAVVLIPQPQPRGSVPYLTAVLPDGTFEFPKMLPGTYVLRSFGGTENAVTTVTVGSGDVVDVRLAADQPVRISGRLLGQDGMAVPDLPRLTISARSEGFRETVSTEQDGTFTLTLPPRDTQISIAGFPTGVSLKSISYGGRDYTSQPIKIDELTQEMRIIADAEPWIATRGVKVSGYLKNRPQEFEKRELWIRLLSHSGVKPIETWLKNDGTFEFPRVVPGSYTIDALSATYNGRDGNTQVLVGETDITGLAVDLNNNPFPELGVGSSALVFDSNRQITLHGVITQPPTRLRGPVYYFRVKVTNEATSVETTWAIHVMDTAGDPAVMELKAGVKVSFPVVPSRDGSPRGSLNLRAGENPLDHVVIRP